MRNLQHGYQDLQQSSLQVKEIAHDVEHFKEDLKKNFLYSNPFYTLDEYSIYKDN
jgi:hypothetical protein